MLIDKLESYNKIVNRKSALLAWVDANNLIMKRNDFNLKIVTRDSRAPDEITDLMIKYLFRNRIDLFDWIRSKIDSDETDIKTDLLLDLQAKIDELSAP